MIEKENELTIQYQGFHPADFTGSFLTRKMEELLTEAPTGATLNAVFTRKNHSFKGVLTISSPSGKFFAIAAHTRLREVNRRLFEQMRKQFDKWKSTRYQHESLRSLSSHMASP